MLSRRSLLALPLGVLACTPPLDPSWLITTPREIALDIQVVDQGPYGERIVPGPRTARDALPLDTLALRPTIVDAEGPIDPDGLEGIWMLCSGIGNCLLRRPISESPRCDGEDIQPDAPCIFDDGGTATLTIADFPEQLPSETSTVYSLISGPTVAMLASTPDGPGIEACIARLDGREPLGGCLMMERILGLGPLGDLVETLEGLGIDSGIEGEAESLLARPRNHNPAVERLRVEYDGESKEIDAGTRITVPRDASVSITVLTTEDDLDSYEVSIGDQEFMFSDDLGADWWFDRELDRLDQGFGLTTEFRAGAVTGLVRAYVVVRDNLGGEGSGFVEIEFGGG